MRRWWLLLLSLVVVLPAKAAVSFVQGGKSSTVGTSGNSGTVTPGSNVTAGDLVVVYGTASNETTSANYSCTDTLSNTYSTVGGTTTSGFAESYTAFCWTISGSTGSDTITFKTSNNPNNGVAMVVAEYSGLQASPYDNAAGTTGSAGYGTSQASPAMSTTNANDLIVAAISIQSGATSLAISGYTIRNSGAPADLLVIADKTVSSSGSQSGTWTWTNNENSAASIAGFKIAIATNHAMPILF